MCVCVCVRAYVCVYVFNVKELRDERGVLVKGLYRKLDLLDKMVVRMRNIAVLKALDSWKMFTADVRRLRRCHATLFNRTVRAVLMVTQLDGLAASYG